MADPGSNKAAIRKHLREVLAAMSIEERHERSLAACALLTSAPEFAAARTIMLYLAMPSETDTSAIALRAWQEGKTVAVPKVSWDQRRMLAVEISSLSDAAPSEQYPVREPREGNPVPVDLIDLVIVPGLGFSPTGHRIGRGMGFYDRFLGQPGFLGLSCGFGFETQVVAQLPVLDHDVPLSMLVTDRAIRRFASHCITESGG
jgi:5-formyltetrahydrofolate cyclo-ligase